MAELTPKERLLPSLRERLTDHEPHKREELRDQRATSMIEFRKSVLEDLDWLMNTINLESVVDLSDYPELASTVINYGMPSLSGNTTAGAELQQIEKQIKQAIVAFEPRILKNTVKVEMVADAELLNQHSIAFEVKGMLWGSPVPEALFLRTELDLELGDVKVTEG